MPNTIQVDIPDTLLTGPVLRARLRVCDMSIRRWVQAGKFPPPDLRINGRNYWREGTYANWLNTQTEAEETRRGEEV